MTKHNGNIEKYFASNNNVICDICGRKRKASEVIDAYGSGDIPVVISCKDGCADYRHPLNSPPPIIFDGQPVTNARPPPKDVFITTTVPSFMTWGKIPAGLWGQFNLPNNEFNLSGMWTWGNFRKN